MYTWGYLKEASLAKLDLTETEATTQNLMARFHIYANEVITQICSSIKPKHTFATFNISKDEVFTILNMPSDFVSFGDDICTRKFVLDNGNTIISECCDEEFAYHGYNQIQFFKDGVYTISYNARWITFTHNTSEDTKLDIPTDILECIPSYIAHQCYKIDDEIKAAVYRNEYELFLSRIDDTNFKNTKTIRITGDW